MKKIIIMTIMLYSLKAEILIKNIFAKESLPGSKNSLIFMEIQNNFNYDINLISAKSDVSNFTEIHTHKSNNGLFIMKKIENLKIKKHQNLNFKENGIHIMLLDLKKPLKEKDNVKLQLFFDNTKNITLKIPVKK